MKPVDSRLLRYAAAARAFFVVGALLAAAQVVCVVAFAWLVSSIVVSAVGGAPLPRLALSLAALAGVVLVRSALAWLTEINAARGAAVVKSQLRREVLLALPRLGPAWLANRNSVAVTTVVTRGLDALDTYFAKYLPQLILAVVATPVVVVVLFLADWQSGLTVLLTLPLVPVFMILIGWATQKAQSDQWAQLTRLSSGFLDVVEGLSTLKVFGREKRQATRIRSVTDEYRSTTMKVLRFSFLSGFALELAASLSVALVAVSIGLRLVNGSLALGVGLFVLMLAPEAFLPLRQVGAQFHAAADGVAATDDVFEILDAAVLLPADTTRAPAAAHSAPPSAVGSSAAEAPDARPAPRRAPRRLVLDTVGVRYRDDVVVRDVTAVFEPGELTVITGPSGAGKSSLVAAMLGFAAHSGDITLEPIHRATAPPRAGIDVKPGGGIAMPPHLEPSAESDTAATQSRRPVTREHIAWAGQRPGLIAASVADNVTLGSLSPAPELIERALALAAASDLDPAMQLGVNGTGLSGGQAQRVAVARAFYRALERECQVIVLDEPSSALDAATEQRLVTGVREVAAAGAIVVVVSHRAAFVDAADRVLRMEQPSALGAAGHPEAVGDRVRVF